MRPSQRWPLFFIKKIFQPNETFPSKIVKNIKQAVLFCLQIELSVIVIYV